MSRRHVEIRFVSPSCALVSGYGTREMLTELTGRAPVWATRDRAWVTQPHRARDLVAILEFRGGVDIAVSHAATASAPEPEPERASSTEAPDPGERLW